MASAAEAGAGAGRQARASATRSAQRGQDLGGERARVGGRGRVPLVALVRGEQRDAVGREAAGRDHRGGVGGEAGEVGVLGAVVGDQQGERGRRRRVPAGLHRRPWTMRRSARLRIASGSSCPSMRWRVQPRGRARSPAARRPTSRRTPPARAAGCRGRTSSPCSPSPSRELELVLEPLDPGVGDGQPPAAVLAREVQARRREPGGRDQPHAGEPAVGVGEVQAKRVGHGGDGSAPAAARLYPAPDCPPSSTGRALDL